MIAMLLSPAGKLVGAFLVAGAVIGGAYVKGRHDGRASLLERMADERVTVLKDGKEVDEGVFAADDDGLCALLGGCL